MDGSSTSRGMEFNSTTSAGSGGIVVPIIEINVGEYWRFQKLNGSLKINRIILSSIDDDDAFTKFNNSDKEEHNI